ncbi:universal stress protein [Pseudonocardia xishanensis]|uniref:Universal stress protein n=1 Tax=Pseudonocardia xishanensis TaxID=630995 RepID=A0ABP8RTD5_9PSEU
MAREDLLVGVDGSALSTEAVRWAAAEAARHGWRLRLVRAYQLPDGTSTEDRNLMRTHVRRQLWTATHAAHAVAPDVPVQQEDVERDPFSVLETESASARALVLGARGVGGFGALLLGSVSDTLTRRAACPVVVVRGPEASDEALRREDRIRPVVVGIDGSPASEAAVAYAFAEADAWHAPLVAVHAWSDYLEDPSGVEIPMLETEEREVLAERLAGWAEKYPDVRVSREVVLGSAAKALVARSVNARAVVVGSFDRGRVRRAVLGSTGRALLHHARSPVAVVRATT